MKNIIITGGAGFIGSNCIREFLKTNKYKILNIDLLTYAGNSLTIKDFENENNYSFVKGDIGDDLFLKEEINKFKPDFIINFAAESHVDRSITSSLPFIKTNILGTYFLLENSLSYLNKIDGEKNWEICRLVDYEEEEEREGDHCEEGFQSNTISDT